MESRSRLVLLGLLPALPASGSIWLGLTVMRFYRYGPESEPNLCARVVRTQELVFRSAIVLGLIAVQWSIAEATSIMGRKISRRLVGTRKAWWNRPLKGTWRLRCRAFALQ